MSCRNGRRQKSKNKLKLTDSPPVCYILPHMFNRLENNLREQGKGDFADIVKILHKLNGADIPLPRKEGETTFWFSPEQRKGLERKGYLFYPLTGQTIASLRDAGCQFSSTWHEGDSFETLASRRVEVAINPKRLFLSKSNEKTLDKQVAMIAEFGKKIGSEVAGTTAILGSVADYAEVYFAHLVQTEQLLFGKDFDYNSTRTETPTDKSNSVYVGQDYGHYGLNVHYMSQDDGHTCIWAAPLVVPTAAVGR